MSTGLQYLWMEDMFSSIILSPLCPVDMGVQLFLDILRSLSPSHVVRLIPKRRCGGDILKSLPQLSEDYLTSTPGLFTPADKAASHHHAASGSPYRGRGLHVDPFPGVGEVQSTVDLEKPGSSWEKEEGVEGERERMEEGAGGDISSDIEMYGSSEEEFTISANSR